MPYLIHRNEQRLNSWLGETETQLCSNLNVLMTNECLEPIYGQDGEECYLLPVSTLITLNSTSAQSRLRCSAFVIGHDCLLSNMERWLHSAIWRNSSLEMYLSKLATARIINPDFPYSEFSSFHRSTVRMFGCCQGWQSKVKQGTRFNSGERMFPRVVREENTRLSRASILPGRIMREPDLGSY